MTDATRAALTKYQEIGSRIAELEAEAAEGEATRSEWRNALAAKALGSPLDHRVHNRLRDAIERLDGIAPAIEALREQQVAVAEQWRAVLVAELETELDELRPKVTAAIADVDRLRDEFHAAERLTASLGMQTQSIYGSQSRARGWKPDELLAEVERQARALAESEGAVAA